MDTEWTWSTGNGGKVVDFGVGGRGAPKGPVRQVHLKRVQL